VKPVQSHGVKVCESRRKVLGLKYIRACRERATSEEREKEERERMCVKERMCMYVSACTHVYEGVCGRVWERMRVISTRACTVGFSINDLLTNVVYYYEL